MPPSPRCETRRCTMRQQSGTAPLPAGSPRLLAIIISSLFPLPRLPFSLFSSFCLFTRQVPRWCRGTRTNFPRLLFPTRDRLALGDNDYAIYRARYTVDDDSHGSCEVRCSLRNALLYRLCVFLWPHVDSLFEETRRRCTSPLWSLLGSTHGRNSGKMRRAGTKHRF